LDQSLDKARHAELLLLQPNNAADALRRWLYNNGFHITEETLTLDAGKMYCLICAKWTGEFSDKDDLACYIGEKLLESQDPLLENYLKKKLKELEVIIAGRDKADPDKSRYNESVQGMDTKTCIYIRDRLKGYLGQK
jgi:tRNA (adenine22-N1)-methyltransferase